jgi:hypothetical protein
MTLEAASCQHVICVLQHNIAPYAVTGSHNVFHGIQLGGLATNMLATYMPD